MNNLSDISAENKSGRLVRLAIMFAVVSLAGFLVHQGLPATRANKPEPAAGHSKNTLGTDAVNSTTPTPADTATSTPTAPARAPEPPPFLVAGWLPFWDTDEGMKVIREFPDALDEISPFWYKIAESGSIERAPGAGSEEVMRLLKSMSKQIFPTISGFDATRTTGILNDPQKRATHISLLVDLAVRNGYDGIDIDYESLHPQDRDIFSQFIRELSSALHDKDKKLITTVYAKTSFPGSPGSSYPHDYKELGAASDRIRIMAYDQHYRGGPAGPIASLAWVESVVDYAVTEIPKEKIILGVPAFGYDWPTNGTAGKSVVHDDVAALSLANNAPVQWDDNASSPFLNYEESGVNHTVWFENHRSIKAKVELARRQNLGGVVIWRLGREDKQIYRLLAEY